MNIHWVNPSFLDYRVPLYQAINELADGNFYVTYSKNRVPERIVQKIEAALGANATGLTEEKIIHLGKQGNFANQGISIPIQKGLLKAIESRATDVLITEGFFQWAPFTAYVAKKKNIPLWVAYERTKHTERFCPFWRATYRKVFDSMVSGYLVNGMLTHEYLVEDIGVAHKPLIQGCMSADSEGLALQVNAVDEAERVRLKQSLRITEGLTFLFVGQLIDRKGVLPLLQAWEKYCQQYPTDHLIIVGTGDLAEGIQQRFGHLPSVHLLGSVDYDKIYQYYALSDVFVMPTLEDNWSLVVPEAMACGLPVATTLYNGCYPELVKEGENGFVFDSEREEDIIRTLERFQTVDLKVMGRKSVAIESNYSTKVVALRIFQALHEAHAPH